MVFGHLPDRIGGARVRSLVFVLIETAGLLMIWLATSPALMFIGSAVIGALDHLEDLPGRALISYRGHLTSSVIGGITETQEVVDYCAVRNIKADIELMCPDQISQALDRVVNQDVR